jgi:putative DNA primase/helicase
MGNISDILGGQFKRTVHKALPPDQQFLNAIYESGIEAPMEIIPDGDLHKFKTSGKSRSGWYVFHTIPGSEVCVGVYGDWRTGAEHKFITETDKEISSIEQMKIATKIQEAKQKRDEEKAKEYEVNSIAVSQIWDSATAADDNHPYLKKKGVLAHGTRVTGDGRLILPLYTEEGTLASLQYISNTKLFHKGGKTGSCLWVIGPDTEKVFLVEGFADAATIVEETGCRAYIAYSGANMVKIAQFIKDSVSTKPNYEIIVVADNDDHGKGQEFAQKAADSINARLIIPPEQGDINDYRLNGGDVSALLNTIDEKVSQWLITGDEFCSQPAPIQWLIKGWLQREATCMIHGASGSGKTFLVLDMALTVSSGLPEWNGHRVTKGNVVYLAGEGHHGLKSRIAGWKQSKNVDTLGDFYVSRTGLDLDTPEGLSHTFNAIKATGKKPDLIIVDTLHRFLQGDENSAQDAKPMLDSCMALIHEFRCSVLFVHHTGVSAEAKDRARGSSAYKAALENEINVQAEERGKKPMEVKPMKAKDSEMESPKFFNLVSTPIDGWLDEDNEQVKTAILKAAEAPTKEETNIKLQTQINTLEAIYFSSDMEREGDFPVISKNDIVNYLIESGKTEGSAIQESKPSAPGKLINNLLKEKIVRKSKERFLVVGNQVLSRINLLGTSGTCR